MIVLKIIIPNKQKPVGMEASVTEILSGLVFFFKISFIATRADGQGLGRTKSPSKSLRRAKTTKLQKNVQFRKIGEFTNKRSSQKLHIRYHKRNACRKLVQMYEIFINYFN